MSNTILRFCKRLRKSYPTYETEHKEERKIYLGTSIFKYNNTFNFMLTCEQIQFKNSSR